MPWYRAGSVAITAGQQTVTGTGTAFSANSRVGDAFQGPDGRWYEVTNIASAAVLSIYPAYQGATVTGGSYGLAPMQGYVKDSADKLRQIVEQWGATLAGLGSVSTEDVVPVAKGGTGGTTQVAGRTGLGLKSAAVADIIGELSQSGGTPTGALMQYVTNAVGEYWKFASGLMISTHRVSVSSTSWLGGGSGPRYTSIGSSLPATFIEVPKCFVQVKDGDVGSRSSWVTTYSATVSSITPWFASIPSSVSNNGIIYEVFAVGRWF